ncbi:protein of unknown function [Spirosomataceae bacterium TFI 002]|nr:protein of unknown function [Spirosomataceae bacterium TFI 002]
MVIEGNLTTSGGSQFVQLREAIPNGSTSSFFKAIKGAVVSVQIEGEEEVSYIETIDGYFEPPSDFSGEIGKVYSLKVVLANGDVLISDPQKLRSVPPIDKVYQKTNLEGRIGIGKTGPVTEIYLDTKDPSGLGDNYLWTWKNYEKQNICASCFGGKWFENPRPEGRCLPDVALQESNTTYDYSCDKPCWDIYRSQEILAQSDFLSDGLTITGKKIAQIPFYNPTGGLLIVEQQLVSEEAYKYLKLLINQGQNTGGLADTPPAALVGNLKNMNNPEEAIGGFFLVANSATYSYWIDRSDVEKLEIQPYGLLKGRFTNSEPSLDLRPPLAPCLSSPSRTDVKPDAFIF